VRNGQAGRRLGKGRVLGDGDVEGQGPGVEGGEVGGCVGSQLNSNVGRAAEWQGGEEAGAFTGDTIFGWGDAGKGGNGLENTMDRVAKVVMKGLFGVATGEEKVAEAVGGCK
jgi:hypothetical protein